MSFEHMFWIMILQEFTLNFLGVGYVFSYTPLRIVSLVYNKTDIPLQLEE